jgi:hypothetical protein
MPGSQTRAGREQPARRPGPVDRSLALMNFEHNPVQSRQCVWVRRGLSREGVARHSATFAGLLMLEMRGSPVAVGLVSEDAPMARETTHVVAVEGCQRRLDVLPLPTTLISHCCIMCW